MAATSGDLAEALDDLEQRAVLWLTGTGDFEPVVRAACDALVAGGVGDALAALAGESVSEPVYVEDTHDAVRAALAEQGRPLPPPHSEAALVSALKALARQTLGGRLAPREFAAWAHRVFGHQGLPMAQPIVVMDDRYDLIGTTTDDEPRLDNEVRAYCHSILERG